MESWLRQEYEDCVGDDEQTPFEQVHTLFDDNNKKKDVDTGVQLLNVDTGVQLLNAINSVFAKAVREPERKSAKYPLQM